MNWLDVVLGVILLLSVLAGFAKGLARSIVGLTAVVLGLVAALWFYGWAGGILQGYIGSRQIANLIGFFTILLGAMVLGALLGGLLGRLLRLVHLSWLDRLLGGAFGLVRGALIAGGIVAAVMAFSAKPPPRVVAGSAIAPYVVTVSNVIVAAAPYELRQGFRKSYEYLRKLWNEQVSRKVSNTEIPAAERF